MARQLHRLSKGHINGEVFTLPELGEVLQIWMRGSDEYVGQISLPDGDWFFLIDRFPHDDSQFDYLIPETREQEKKLVADFLGIEL